MWAPWIAALLLLTFFAYAAALNNLFIPFDDNILIYQNPAVAHVSLQNLWAIFTSYDPELYIPVTFLAYQFIHAIAGFNAGAFHAASLLLHGINIILLAGIIWSLTKKRSVALMVGALFALHPLNSEVVLWAAAMKDVLSSMFGLLSLLMYLQYRSTGERRFWMWCIIAFTLGLLAKVSIVLFPLLFLLIDWSQQSIDRKALLKKWPLYLLSILFFIIAIAGKSQAIGDTGFLTTALLSFKATAFYCLKLLWPTHLSILYPQLHAPLLTDSLILLSIAVVIALLIAAIFLRKRVPLMTAGIVWYLLLLLPSFSTFNKNGHLYFASARYAYLPSIGLFLIMALLVTTLWQRIRLSRVPLGIIGAIVTLLFVILTHRQVLLWHDIRTLFGHVIREYPDAVIAYNNYATELKDDPEALVYFRKAVTINPEFILPYRNMANFYGRKGDEALRKAMYEEAVPILLAKKHPILDDLALLFEYAEFLDESGNRQAMYETLQKAVSMRPDFSEAHYNLGVKYEKYGQLDLAAPSIEHALAINPYSPDTLYHLASVYAQTGKLVEAAELLERLIDINPTYEKAVEHLANIKKLIGE